LGISLGRGLDGPAEISVCQPDALDEGYAAAVAEGGGVSDEGFVRGDDKVDGSDAVGAGGLFETRFLGDANHTVCQFGEDGG